MKLLKFDCGHVNGRHVDDDDNEFIETFFDLNDANVAMVTNCKACIDGMVKHNLVNALTKAKEKNDH